jgi:transcription elongation factor GreA
MVKYLTKFGMAAIREKMALLQARQAEALAGAGEAAQSDPNAYHDNFAYEEGMRQQELLSVQLRALCKLMEGAHVAPEPADNQRVAIGHFVVVRRQDSTDDEGYFLCGDGEGSLLENACSASSPMGQALLGMAAGETKTVSLGPRSCAVRVLAIRPATAADIQVVTIA